MAKFLDSNGLLYLWQKIKSVVPTKVSDLTNDTGFITSADVPEGSTASGITPLMDGTASKGSDNGFARGDHVHPSDTSKQNLITSSSKLSATLIAQDSSNRMVSDTEKSTWDGKQDAINSSNKLSYTLVSGLGALATQDSLDASAVGAVPVSSVGAASGVCPLGADSKIANQYLPSYVDDVVETYIRTGSTELSSEWLSLTNGGAALTPEGGKIYVILSAGNYLNTTYRWGGSTYVKIADVATAITNSEIDTIVDS